MRFWIMILVLVPVASVSFGGYLFGGVTEARTFSGAYSGAGVVSLAEEYQQDQEFLRHRYLQLEDIAFLDAEDIKDVPLVQYQLFRDDLVVQAIFAKWGHTLPTAGDAPALPDEPLFDGLLSP